MNLEPVGGLVTIQTGSPEDCEAVGDYLRSLGAFDVGDLVRVPADGQHGVVWQQKLCLVVPDRVRLIDMRYGGLYIIPPD
jgi:hypothetical protein